MITGATDQVPELQGLILIDCWEPSIKKREHTNQFYQNIIDRTQHHQFECVVNSANNVLIDMADLSMANLFYFHCNNSILGLTEHLQNQHNQVVANSCRWAHQTYNPEHHTHYTSSRLLHDHFFTDRRGIYLMKPLDIVFHNQQILNSRVRNWLVVGKSWQLCTHKNGVGFDALAEVAAKFDVNFYTTDFGLLKTDDQTTAQYADFEADDLAWQHVENFGYRLVPNADSRFIGKYSHA
jgi:hypothetical protein